SSRDILDRQFSDDIRERVEMHEYMGPHATAGKQTVDRGSKMRASARVSKNKKYGSISDEIEEKDDLEEDEVIPLISCVCL
ncbi:Transporter, partial [Caligus rogercresseyi]